jgi:hypothetical protein
VANLDELYERCPSLKISDQWAAKSIPNRLWLLEMLPKESVGVELGVFTGMFAEQMVRVVRPKRLHLVDHWWKQGEVYRWGREHTDFGRLPTRIAYEAAVLRTAGATEAIVTVDDTVTWIEGQPDASLDWAYIDSSHFYEHCTKELTALAPKIKPEGFILGDDWYLDPEHVHAGVRLAVNDFVRRTDFDILIGGKDVQWIVSRRLAPAT